jgi:hypothetical protein
VAHTLSKSENEFGFKILVNGANANVEYVLFRIVFGLNISMQN